MSYTPGPWCYEQCGDKCNDIFIGVANRVSESGDVAVTQEHGRLEATDENGDEIEFYREGVAYVDDTCSGALESNARLIAAAPDLLESLSAVIGMIQLACARENMPGDIRAVFEKSHIVAHAQATIRTAAGELAKSEEMVEIGTMGEP